MISAYLLIKKLSAGPVAGCGAGSSCSAVLNSSFAYFLPGIPVTVPAILTYVALIFGLLTRAKGARAEAWEMVVYVGALIVVGAAVWFISLQGIYLKKFCPWCTIAHVLGGVGAALVLFKLRPAQKELLIIGIGVAAFAMASMAGFQKFLPQKTTKTARVGPPGMLGDGKVISFGPLELQLGVVPFRGNPDSSKRMILMFDYTCNSCRRVHGYLKRAEDRFGKDNYLVVMLPTPLHPNCNRYFEEDMPEHRNSCSFAKMAMAIWWTDPEKFYEFDHWMIETGGPSFPPDAAAARAKAEELVGKEALDKALENPSLDKQIEVITKIYNQAREVSKNPQMPKMIMSDGVVVVGVPENEFALYEILEQRLGVTRLPK